MAPVVEAYQAMRGVSVGVAVTFVAEIGDLRRFDNPRQLMAFLGLVPSERSTGTPVPGWRERLVPFPPAASSRGSICSMYGVITKTTNDRIARFVLWPRFRSWSVHSDLPISGPTRPFGTPKIGGMRE
jgi:hypothetical protein